MSQVIQIGDRARSRIKAVLLIVVVLIVLAWFIIRSPDNYQPWVATGAHGALVAVAELVTRYRDDPPSALFSVPGEIYIIVNIVSAVAAFYLIRSFDWQFGATPDTLQVTRVLVAGFGSAGLFRSSLFNVTAGDQVIGIGPSAVLNVILSAADRAVDRQRALVRARFSAQIMSGLKFETTADSMLAFTAAAMQNLTDDEAKSIDSKISVLRDKKTDDVPDEIKSYILGLALLSLTGRRTLQAIAEQVRGAYKDLEEPSTGSGQAPPVPADSPDASLLAYLRGAGGPVTIPTLQEQLALNYREISEVLSRLQTAGAIEITGDAGSQSVALVV